MPFMANTWRRTPPHPACAGAWDLDLADHSSHRTPIHDRIFGYETLLPQWTYEMFLDHEIQSAIGAAGMGDHHQRPRHRNLICPKRSSAKEVWYRVGTVPRYRCGRAKNDSAGFAR